MKSLKEKKHERILQTLVTIAVAGLLLFGAAVFLSGCKGKDAAEGEKAAQVEGAVGYTCPMHPEFISQHADDECPICGMDLVPVKSDKQPDHPSTHAGAKKEFPLGLAPIHVDSSKIQLIGVKTAKAHRMTLIDKIEAYGIIEIPEESIAKVHTRSAGWVSNLRVKRTGDQVKRGHILFSIFSPDAFQAQQEYVLLVSRLQQAGGQLPSLEVAKNAARIKLEVLGVTPGTIRHIEKTLKPVKKTAVISPAKGYVMMKNLFNGMYVTPATEVLEIANLSKVWISLRVHQDVSGLIKEGDGVVYSTDVLPGVEFKGTVDQIYPGLDPELRSREIRVIVENKDGKLVPGMYGMASITIDEAEGIALPEDAVIFGGDTSYVFVAAGDGHFEPRTVETGLRHDGRLQILSGVEAGETVVTSANFLLDSESKLRAAASNFGDVDGEEPDGKGEKKKPAPLGGGNAGHVH